MTVKELAIQYRTTPRTIYRRLIKHGLNIDELRDSDGKLSDEAVERIGELFANDGASAVANCVAEPVAERDAIRRAVSMSHNEETEDLRKKLADAEARATAAEAEVRRLSDRVDDLTRQLSDLRSDRDEWRRAASESRALQLQQMRLLPERVGVVERVRGWFNRTKKTEE